MKIKIAMIAALALLASAGRASEPDAGVAVVRSAQIEAGKWTRDFGARDKPFLVEALSQREAQIKRAEELALSKEKVAFSAFALSALALGLSQDQFWEAAPAPVPVLQGKRSAAFSDGSTLRFESAAEGAIELAFDGLSANGCRALAESIIERAIDETGRSNPFRKHQLIGIEFGRQTLEASSFAQARSSMAPTEGVAAQWMAARQTPASEAALALLRRKEWDPCAQMRPGESLSLKFQRKNKK